jgi:hypothetical protein
MTRLFPCCRDAVFPKKKEERQKKYAVTRPTQNTIKRRQTTTGLVTNLP